MNWRIAVTVAACLTLTATRPAVAQHAWGYSGEGGPQNWGKLDPGFATCATGKNQSPIDIQATTKGNLKPVRIDYKNGTTEILNNGHTVQVNYRAQIDAIATAAHAPNNRPVQPLNARKVISQ